MTSEEVERAIKFLLKSQASFEARLEQTNKQIGILIETQNEFTQVVTQFIQAQGEINNRLSGLLERHIKEGH
jgi:prefoldin subunit 5